MSGKYRPIYNSKRRSRYTSRRKGYGIGGKIMICLALILAAIAVRLLFPDFTDSIYNKLFHQADYSAAFSSIGAGLNGDVSMKDALKDAYAYAFAGKSADTESQVNGDTDTETSVQVIEVYNGAQQDALAAFAENQQAFSDLDLPDDVTEDMLPLPFSETVWPVDGEILSGFGYRLDSGENTVEFHYGVDIAAAQGSEVVAFTDGTVSVVGTSTTAGNYVIIEHENAQSQYAHLDSVTVTSGQSVTAGQSIGTAGIDDKEQVYLHFQLEYDGKYINPEYYYSSP